MPKSQELLFQIETKKDMEGGGRAAARSTYATKGRTVSEAHTCAQQIKWFNIFVSESLLALPPGLPLEFLQLEKLLMSYRSVHVVIDERAREQIC